MIHARAFSRLFRNDLAARFVDRPNRYLVRARSARGRLLRVYCPNPGRLMELLEPGVELYLERAAGDGRRTRYTLAGCRHPRTGEVVPLYATRSNRLARELVLPRLFPDAVSIRPEVRLGGSRIDFAVERPSGPPEYVEVKTCTLVEHGVAMFPDAPTTRGLRHLEELARLDGHGHALFVLMGRTARRMVPNVHTDPAFAFGLERMRDRLGLHAVAVSTGAEGRARIHRADVPVDLEPIGRLREAGARDTRVGGIYLLRLELRRARRIRVGALGTHLFRRGVYLYVGSALGGLEARVARHLRRRKTARWHVDYIAAMADDAVAYPVATARALECRLACDVGRIARPCVPGFGSSDCGCLTHLYVLPDGARAERSLREIVLRYRHVVSL